MISISCGGEIGVSNPPIIYAAKQNDPKTQIGQAWITNFSKISPLFRKKRFMLDKMTWCNASKVIFFIFHFMLLYYFLMKIPQAVH